MRTMKKTNKYQNYLITRNYSPLLVAKKLLKVSQVSPSCDDAQKPCNKVPKTVSAKKHLTSYNPILPNINNLIKYLTIFSTKSQQITKRKQAQRITSITLSKSCL